jgi:hypothetical protein
MLFLHFRGKRSQNDPPNNNFIFIFVKIYIIINIDRKT